MYSANAFVSATVTIGIGIVLVIIGVNGDVVIVAA